MQLTVTRPEVGPVAEKEAWPDGLVDLYHREHRTLVRTAYVLLGSRHEAEEVVHDALLALRRRWDTVDQPGAYLRTSVVNGARGVLRRREVAERFRPDPPPPGQPDGLVELRDLVLDLPWKQRTAIVLRYVADLPDAEIARHLDVEPATVRSLVARGLGRLRRDLTGSDA